VRRGGFCTAALALACPVLAGPLPAAPSFTPTPLAQANYMLNCMGCHLADGSGASGKVPSLRKSLPMLARSRTGRRYLVQVPGSSQSALSNGELAEVLNWMVRNLSAGTIRDDFAPFTASEVGDYRRFTLVNMRHTRARLLAASAERSGR
jgi:hypothetical protein